MTIAALEAATLASFTALLPLKTRVELTNQRAGEAGLAKPTTVNSTVLTEAITNACAEVALHIGSTHQMATKLSVELTIADLCTKWARNPSDMGFADRADIEGRMMKAKATMRQQQDGMDTGDKLTGWKPGPLSGHNPFDTSGWS